jgi:predicted outer membrane protein
MAVAFSVSTSQAQTSNQQASGLNTADQHFLNEAVEGDLSEINMGKLPPTEGREQKVKQFGQMQEQRHSQHLERPKITAQQPRVTPPLKNRHS